MESANMQAIRVETTIQEDSSLVIEHLPLRAGAEVEVIILVKSISADGHDSYPLRNIPITYADPTEPVAQDDWEAGR
jgi:hypothetical protein